METKTIKLGDIEFKNRYFLGPNEKYHDYAFRELVRPYNPAMCFSEKITAESYRVKSRSTLDILSYIQKEHSENKMMGLTFDFENPVDLQYAILHLWQTPSISYFMIDFTPYIRKLVDNETYFQFLVPLIESLLLSTKPVILYMNLKRYEKQGLEFIRELPIATFPSIQGICIETNPSHAKEDIKKIKEKHHVPVLLSVSKAYEDKSKRLLDVLEETGADAFMLTSIATGHPLVFEDLIYAETDRHKVRDGLIRQGDLLKEFIRLEFENYNYETAIRHVRNQFAFFVEDFVNRDDVNKAIAKIDDHEEFFNIAAEVQYK